MGKKIGLKYVPALGLVGLVAFANGGCSSVNNAVNDVQGATSGCPAFSQGDSAIEALQIDGNTKAIVLATYDLVAAVKASETDVFNACVAIDTDLGVTDTWTAKSGLDAQMTEACNQANTKIKAILMAAKTAQASCSLNVSGGQCSVNVMAIANCEASCEVDAGCTPPTVMTACTPGEISGQCSAMCDANAYCEGSATVEAECNGSCSADCDGSCQAAANATVTCNGTCSGVCSGTCDGTATASGGATCTGTCVGQCSDQCTYATGVKLHCSGSCNGKCTGDCKILTTGGINCGANVNCRGGCSVAYTAPTCEGTLMPPMCNASGTCQSDCSADAQLQASCTKPTAALECTGGSSLTDLATLETTLAKNLPAIYQAAMTEGPIIKASAMTVATDAQMINVSSLNGMALACANVVLQAYTGAVGSINATVNVSVTVSATASAGTT
jgi:hypothetical protein